MIVLAHIPPPVAVINRHSQSLFVEHGVDLVEQNGNGQHPQVAGLESSVLSPRTNEFSLKY